MTDKEIELALETIALVLEDLKKTQEKQQAAITAIKQTLAEHAMRETQRLGQEIEQEPVALSCCGYTDASAVKWNPFNNVVQCHNCGQVYTAPPQRTWVNLTDEDRNDCLVEADPCECLATPEAQELMRCVEAKSKELNHGK